MGIDEARHELDSWRAGARDATLSMAQEFGIDAGTVDRDPLSMLSAWDDFLERLPFDDFDDDDWFWLQSQLAAYISHVLVNLHSGHWDVVADAAVPSGFKYVVVVTGWDGEEHQVDVLELAYNELRNDPPSARRMLGNAEVTAHVTIQEE